MNKPSWFIEAIDTGMVGGRPIPKWFQKETEKRMSEVTNMIKGTNVTKTTTTPTTVDPMEPSKPIGPVSVEDPFSGKWPHTGVGAKYRKHQVKRWSYYYTPIEDREIRGRSRVWGDADETVKAYVRNALMETGRTRGMDQEQIALMLAMVHLESGFNPDAAAGPSSARGVGQFINSTGEKYGLNKQNHWDVNEQVRAFADHFQDNVKRSGDNGLTGVYVLHYAGSFKNSHHTRTGWKLSRGKVMPLMRKYLKVIQSGTE